MRLRTNRVEKNLPTFQQSKNQKQDNASKRRRQLHQTRNAQTPVQQNQSRVKRRPTRPMVGTQSTTLGQRIQKSWRRIQKLMALAKSQQSLKNWTNQKWRTSDGTPSKGKKRYLPDAAWNALTPAERQATNAAKARGNAKGKQFVPQPKKVAKKTSNYR